MREITNPFPGIRSFETYEAPIFFGRDKHVAELNRILLEKRFVAIMGASGTGKSSLVKAGVIPFLQESQPDANWKIVHFKPGDNPIFNLAGAFVCMLGGGEGIESTDFIAGIRTNDSFLHETIVDIAGLQGCKFLFYIDQFEELFRLHHTHNEGDAQCWISNLVYALYANPNIYLTLSVRSDYIGHSIQFKYLPELINAGSYLVPPMDFSELELVITEPLRYFGLSISDELVCALLEDVSRSAEHLLVLQHALMRTFEEWKREDLSTQVLELHHYRAVGGIGQAIALHIEEVYNELESNDDKLVVERVFKALLLVDVQEGGIHMPATILELSEIVSASVEKVIELVERFRAYRNAFLHPLPDVKLDASTVIDLAHDSVLRNWERGRAWIVEENEAAELYIRLSKGAELSQLGYGGVWVNPELALALNWLNNQKPNLAWATRYDPNFERALAFLEHSNRSYQEELWRKEESQKRKFARVRLFVVILSLGVVFSVFVTIIALNLKFQAEGNERAARHNEDMAMVLRKEAEAKSREAVGHEKVSKQQQRIAEEQKLLAELERLFAVKQQRIAIDQKQIAEIETENANMARFEALRQKTAAENARVVAVRERHVADSLRVVAIQETKKSNRLHKLAVARSLAIQSAKLGLSGNMTEVTKLLAKEAFYLNLNNEGTRYEPNLFTALSNLVNVDNVLLGHNDQVRGLCAGADNELLSAGDDGLVLAWDLASKKAKPILQLKQSARMVKVSDKKRFVFVLTNMGNVWMADRQQVTQKMLLDATLPAQEIFLVNDTLLLLTMDNKLWALSPPYELGNLSEVVLQAPLVSMVLSDGGKVACCSFSTGVLAIFSVGREWKQLHSIANLANVKSLAFDADKELVAFADSDYSIQIWDVANGSLSRTNIKHQTKVNRILIHPKWPLVASASYDGSVRLWDYENGVLNEPVVLTAHDSWVHDITFLSDNSSLASAAKDRTIRLWNIVPEDLIEKIEIERDLTPEERYKYIGLESTR